MVLQSLFLPRWLRPVRREPGKLVGLRLRRSSNLLLGVLFPCHLHTKEEPQDPEPLNHQI
jgi:hypothetical protein